MYCVLVIAASILWLYIYIIRSLTHWTNIGVSQKSVLEQIVNILRTVFQIQTELEVIQEFSREYVNKRYNGAYQLLRPTLYLRDPELIKQITVKEFDHFVDHLPFVSEEVEPLIGKNLFSSRGTKWRNMRITLSPHFTGRRMKAMFFLMNDCAQEFVTYFKANPSRQIVEMKDALSRYANDVVATTAFGITCNSLKNPDNDFYVMGKKVANLGGVWRSIKFFIAGASPSLARVLGLTIISPKLADFFTKIVKQTIDLREKTGILRPDMIQLLIEAKNDRLKPKVMDDNEGNIKTKEELDKPPLTDTDLTAHALFFFFAGFESTSTLLCCLMYELAVNPDVQDTLRKEVDETWKNTNGCIGYESLLKMKYLDMVVSETLRKWPTITEITRLCNKPYTIQPLNKDETPVHIAKNDLLILPIFEIHRNPRFCSNPDLFDPQRFSDENKEHIDPYAYIPFGSGPRKCIAFKFAMLEIKLITFHILANFEIHVTPKTVIPLRLIRDIFNLISKDGFWLELKPRRE